ncbi:hypothetical protein B0H10DRAFT_2232858 [Mycena sp. CBHHK59/15]|nr:hypothetical protein B0H10DRAFT_2232858 [Mycena sp. CBHHK59/15]
MPEANSVDAGISETSVIRAGNEVVGKGRGRVLIVGNDVGSEDGNRRISTAIVKIVFGLGFVSRLRSTARKAIGSMKDSGNVNQFEMEEEEKALKAVVIADRERRRIEAIAMVAAIDAEQDAAAEAEEDNAIFTLDDLHEDAMDVDRTGDTADEDAAFLEFTQQDFERVEDDDVYRSPDEFEKLKAKPLAVKKVKKVKVLKGDTRKEVEVATKLLAESKMAKGLAIAVKKKGVQNSVYQGWRLQPLEGIEGS